MKKMQVYLDNNATTKIDERVLEPMIEVMRENYGNPSSVYQVGQRSKSVIEEARESICKLLGIKTRELIFTSGGTESNNLALKGVMEAFKGYKNHLITTKIEHSSVKNTVAYLEENGIDITYLDVDKSGQISLDELENSITENTALISIMHSNNEIGTILPIDRVAKIARKNDIYLHVDAVQSMGKLELNLENIDMMTFSAHKFYGPKGVGALYVKSGTKVDKLIIGGQQERNRRGGTENIAGIYGMSKALELAFESREEEEHKEMALRDHMELRIINEIDEIKINGDRGCRLYNTTNITFKGVEAESLLMSLDMRGIAVSAGSACASSSLTPSHVLGAIGLSKIEARATIRISLGKYNTLEEIDYFVDVLKHIVEIERDMNIY